MDIQIGIEPNIVYAVIGALLLWQATNLFAKQRKNKQFNDFVMETNKEPAPLEWFK